MDGDRRLFVGESERSLPVVPDAWLPTAEVAQFRFAAFAVESFAAIAVPTWIDGCRATLLDRSAMDAVEVGRRLFLESFTDANGRT